jgi:hypothetical protein
MRAAYLWLARLIGLMVAVQAALMAFAISGLFHWIDDGNAVDKAKVDSWEDNHPTWTGAIGEGLHSIIGEMVFPVVVLVFLVVGLIVGRKSRPLMIFPLVVTVLVGLQIWAGMNADSMPYLGLFHGFNAFLIFGAATAAAMTAKKDTVAA